MLDEFIWSQKYRPKVVNDCIIPAQLKLTFQEMLKSKSIPNLLLYGPPGIGKTTVAKALIEELESEYLFINGSLDGNIDTLRHDIRQFASSISLDGNRKFIIIDEADYLNANSTQPALRSFMEEYSKLCGFILTCNYPRKIIDPLRSRCSSIQFTFSDKDAEYMKAKMFGRIQHILQAENIKFEAGDVARAVTDYYPDFRKCINEVQKNSSTGTFVYKPQTSESIKQIYKVLKQSNFNDIRKCVNELVEQGPENTFKLLYDDLCKVEGSIFKDSSKPDATIILADYQYKSAFVVDQEINLTACLIELAAKCELRNGTI